jgi:regulator of RNase E activity RraA
MPLRADIADVDAAEWKAQGNQRPRDHQNAIDLLQRGDVFVVDVSGSVASGGVIGDNLACYIMKTTGAGFGIDGAIRDMDGISLPPAIHNVMVTGIDIPVRIGNTTVMPGDVVFGDREGVSFIPPHLVQGIITMSGRRRSSTRASTSRPTSTAGRGIRRCSSNTRTI